MFAAGSSEMSRLLELAFSHSLGQHFSEEFCQNAIREMEQHYLTMLKTLDLADCGQGILFERGVHRVQQLTYASGGQLEILVSAAAEYPRCTAPDLNLIAAIESLGLLNLAIADQGLPAELCDAAKRWKSAGADGQIGICELVYDALRSDGVEEQPSDLNSEPSAHWLRDYRDQPVERIFPRLFRDAGRPNCFGKAQLLTAFARRVGARHFGATPIISTENFVHPSLFVMTKFIYEWSKERGIELPKPLQDAFERRRIGEHVLEAAPNCFHMALVIELADGRWYMIDPHLCCRGVLEHAAEIAIAAKFVEFNSPLLPGYTILTSESGAANAKLEAASIDAGKMMDVSHKLLRSWNETDRNPLAVLPLLSRKPVLDLLLEYKVGLKEEEIAQAKSGLQGEYYYLRHRSAVGGEQENSAENEPLGPPIIFRDQAGQPLEKEVQQRLQIALQFAIRLSNTEIVKESGGFNPEPLSRVMMRVLGIFQSIAYNKACQGLLATRSTPGMVHPVFELYEPGFRTGVELLAHLNWLHGESNAVIMELASVCGGQHHLVLAATESLRTNQPDSALACDARATLESLPVLLSAARSLFSTGAVPSTTSDELAGA